jgi:hypothetical protein
MHQDTLWHDTHEESLTAVLQSVFGRGWRKKAAAGLWPAECPVAKGKYLENALNPERAEKLAISEIAWILRLGRDHGAHAAMHYFNESAGYGPPQPVEPVDEIAELQRQYISAAKSITAMAERIQRLQVQVAG